MSPAPLKFSVRELAELLFRRGDLYPHREGKAVEPELGIITQQRVQAERARRWSSFQPEVAVKHELCVIDEVALISGRIDGLYIDVTGRLVIEEYKTKRGEIADPNSVDQAQLRFYAALWCLSDLPRDNNRQQERAPCINQVSAKTTIEGTHNNCLEHDNPATEPTPGADTALITRLIYVHPEQLSETVFEESVSRTSALAWFDDAIARLCAICEQEQTRQALRDAGLATLQFPFDQFRSGQRALIGRVFAAFKEKEHLLIESVTGSGKTLALLFAALKAMRDAQQLLYLTSRTRGSDAALLAATQLLGNGQPLAVVQISAKEKVCPVPGMPCDADVCPYAKGYFDRLPGAMHDLGKTKILDQARLQAVAETHQVCPHELSLDAAVQADLIIGDYNYLFDPLAQIRRLQGKRTLAPLVDEAHQLSDRVNTMLSASISLQDVIAAREKSDPVVGKGIDLLGKALREIAAAAPSGEQCIASPTTFYRAITNCLQTFAEADVNTELDPSVTAVWLTCFQWEAIQQHEEDSEVMHLITCKVDDITLQRVCIDASRYIAKSLQRHDCSIRFSATVTPLAVYQSLHGFEDGTSARAPTPFQATQTRTLIIQDIPTYYRQRHASLHKILNVLVTLQKTHPGRYLLALPSYEYLQQLHTAAEGSEAFLLTQRAGASEADSRRLLGDFKKMQQAILAIVMGGALSESVDFADAPLSGVIVVGVGLPPPSVTRDKMVAHFEQKLGSGMGQMIGYTQPAMNKVIQAAGRLIRRSSDRGVICLIDDRFRSNQLQQFFPHTWEPTVVVSTALEHELNAFWHT